MTRYIVKMKSAEGQTAQALVEAEDESAACDKAVAIQEDVVGAGGGWEITGVEVEE